MKNGDTSYWDVQDEYTSDDLQKIYQEYSENCPIIAEGCYPDAVELNSEEMGTAAKIEFEIED